MGDDATMPAGRTIDATCIGDLFCTCSGREERTLTDLSDSSVTIVGVHFAPETTGNAPYTTALAESLHNAGASVRVITGVPHYPQWRLLDRRYRFGLKWREQLNSVDLTRVRHFVPAKPDLLGRGGLEFTFFVQSAAALFRDRSDVIIAITPTLSGLAAALLCRRGRPVGVLVQDLTGASAVESGTSTGRVGAMIAKAEYWLLRKADLVGIITAQFGTAMVANGVDESKIVDLPNFTHISPARISPELARERLSWPQRGFVVVHTGNMGRKQGLETVVEAARLSQELPDPIQFVLVGDGNQRRELELLAEGITNLSFVDPLSSEDYPLALAAADALLVNERAGVMEMSLPSKLTSYCVAERPIVAAVEPESITARVLTELNAGHVISGGSARALCDALEHLRASPEVRLELAQRAAGYSVLSEDLGAAAVRYERFLSHLSALAGVDGPDQPPEREAGDRLRSRARRRAAVVGSSR